MVEDYMNYYVYKLVVRGKPYIGFTSKSPQKRLKEHVDMAINKRWSHHSKLYPLLSTCRGKYDSFEVVYKANTEVEALLKEIELIKEIGKDNTLNLSDGGEGSTVTVRVREHNNKSQLMISPRKRSLKMRLKKGRRRPRRKYGRPIPV